MTATMAAVICHERTGLVQGVDQALEAGYNYEGFIETGRWCKIGERSGQEILL